MNKIYLKLIILLLIVGGVVYTYIVPFTQYQIYKSVDDYLNLIVDKKQETIQFITSSVQNTKDQESISFIVKNYDKFEFTNVSIKIKQNSLKDAIVEVSLVKKMIINNKIQAQPVTYQITLIKALNIQNKKRWIINSRDQI
jgi:hypothetical protein